jgi:hypothetical protein
VSLPTHKPVVFEKWLSMETRKEKEKGNEGKYRRGKRNGKNKLGK